jgi:heme exporter protein D
MIWQSASEFWAMGGYGVYVWGSMGVSAALLALEVWLARMGRSQALDAVCEALDAQVLDAETPGSALATPIAASRSPHFSQGPAT